MRIQGENAERRHADANQLRTLYIATMAGWNRGTGEAFAAPFDDEVDFVAFDGTRFRGRDELIRFHEPLFKTHLRGTRLVGDVTDVRFIREDVAVVHAYGGTVLRGKRAPAPARDSLQTLVAVKRDGQWRFTAFQNTRVRPIGKNVLGTLCWLIGDWFWKWSMPKNHPRPPVSLGHAAIDHQWLTGIRNLRLRPECHLLAQH